MNSKLSIAIAASLGPAAERAIPGRGREAGSEALEEITVTAQRREQSMQDVPISMQALTGQALQQLNITTFDDYIKYLPNVTSANNGPGQNEVFMRGLSAGSQASQGSSSTGLFPNVAIYLDNQSGQLPNRNLDIYAADLNRIEVLEGPQGTLFGAGAEAGVIRYITNQPKIDVTEGSVKAGYGTTAHGDNNSDVTAVLNLPLIAEHMAVRAVIYDDQRGGYIDNVPGDVHIARTPTSASITPAIRRSTARVRTGHAPNDRLLRAAGQSVAQQQQPRRPGHQPGDLPGHPGAAALQDQRRLGRAAGAELPETCIRRACSTSSRTRRTAPP